MDDKFIGLFAKSLIVIITLTILISLIVFYYNRTAENKDSFNISDNSNGQNNGQNSINYVMWIGDISTTLDILALAQQPGSVIQPIYIPNPEQNAARNEYELQITRTLRVMINTKYPESQILPIINITRAWPNDDTFNREYNMVSKTNNMPTRENILARWAKYYKIKIEKPRPTQSIVHQSVANSRKPILKKIKKVSGQNNKKTNNTSILALTWNCRFPVGSNQVPCGLCQKCEKLNSLI